MIKLIETLLGTCGKTADLVKEERDPNKQSQRLLVKAEEKRDKIDAEIYVTLKGFLEVFAEEYPDVARELKNNQGRVRTKNSKVRQYYLGLIRLVNMRV